MTMLDPATLPRTEYVVVTPELAKTWLETNTKNRHLYETNVATYAAAMSRGDFTLNNDAICFSSSGVLLNGQHRLYAVIRADVHVTMLVMYNVPEEAMGNLDIGKSRSVSDYLRLSGEKYSSLLAASARRALLMTDSRMYAPRTDQGTQPKEIEAFIAAHPDLRDAVLVADRYRKQIDITPASIAVAWWMMPDKQAADEFFDQLSTRIGLEAGSPILALDARLRMISRQKVRVTPREELCMVIRAWNAWRNDKTLRSMHLPKPSDRVPEAV